MRNYQILGYFILLLGIGSNGFPNQHNYQLPNDGKIWVLLVAGSDGYGNYRHQADVCHAYQIVHANGIPDENIIVMMKDDIANSASNPTPGIIVNSPGGEDVYHGVPKDYTGKDVNAANFLSVLTGNKLGVQGIGSGRVIESGPNDHIFVNFVDHGGPGILCFPDTLLSADNLIEALKGMAKSSQFAKMIMYIEACYSGSMFDNLLDDDLNIFVTTAADPHESSYACYYDDERNTYLGDVFSVNWMSDINQESLATNDLHHQFEKVRTITNTSHVEEYGDLDIGTTKLVEVLGLNMRSVGLTSNGYQPKKHPITDSHDNIHVPLEILRKQLDKYKEPVKRQQLKLQIRSIEKKRAAVDEVFDNIIEAVAEFPEVKDEINTAKHSLNKIIFPCYKEIITAFSDKCFNIALNPYVRAHLQKFVNICGIPQIPHKKALNAIDNVCDGQRFVNFFAQ